MLRPSGRRARSGSSVHGTRVFWRFHLATVLGQRPFLCRYSTAFWLRALFPIWRLPGGVRLDEVLDRRHHRAAVSSRSRARIGTGRGSAQCASRPLLRGGRYWDVVRLLRRPARPTRARRRRSPRVFTERVRARAAAAPAEYARPQRPSPPPCPAGKPPGSCSLCAMPERSRTPEAAPASAASASAGGFRDAPMRAE